MDLERYLRRINYEGDLTPTLSVLQKLQRTHLLHVPFENLDIHFNRPIELDLKKIYKKIVEDHRGGFCYELNGLFFKLLKTIGFKVKRISARVFDEKRGLGQEFDHLAIIARIEGKDYLTDVGFGEFTFHPLQIELNTNQEDDAGLFRIKKYDDTYLQVTKRVSGTWTPEYLFTLKKRKYKEYREMCHYHQTSPDSHFTQQKLCSMAKPNGRITISGNRVKIKSKTKIQEVRINTEEEFLQYLWNYFGVKIR